MQVSGPLYFVPIGSQGFYSRKPKRRDSINSLSNPAPWSPLSKTSGAVAKHESRRQKQGVVPTANYNLSLFKNPKWDTEFFDLVSFTRNGEPQRTHPVAKAGKAGRS
jgi:hypothetical protein